MPNAVEGPAGAFGGSAASEPHAAGHSSAAAMATAAGSTRTPRARAVRVVSMVRIGTPLRPATVDEAQPSTRGTLVGGPAGSTPRERDAELEQCETRIVPGRLVGDREPAE